MVTLPPASDAMAPAATVADVMIRGPKTCDRWAAVGEVQQILQDDHVHAALLVRDSHLLAVVVRSDIPADASTGVPAATLGRLIGRVVRDTEHIDVVHQQLLVSGQRRLAVIDHAGVLLGLLCLKQSRAGFCTEQDVHDRAGELTGRTTEPE